VGGPSGFSRVHEKRMVFGAGDPIYSRWVRPMRNDRVDNLRAILEPGVSALGFELVDAELTGTGHHTVLRVFIDGPEGVTVDDCAKVSRQVSAILDVDDPLPGQYTLEVSSPGLDRPLVKPADFERCIGETVKIRMYEPLQGRKNFKGDLVKVSADHVVLAIGQESFDLAFAGMEKARLVPKF